MPYSRVRSYDHRKSYVITKWGWDPPPHDADPYLAGAPFGTVSLGMTSTFRDTSHANFERRRRAGEIMMGDCEKLWADLHQSSDTVLRIGPFSDWGKAELRGKLGSLIAAQVPVDYSFLDDVFSLLSSNALVQAYAKMNGSALMSGETMSDFGQTVSMLKRPMGGARDLIGRMIKSRKRYSMKTAKQILDATSKTWLEYRYGWKPLIMDCDTIVQECTRKAAKSGDRLVARSGTSTQRNNSSPFSLTGLGGWPLTATGVVATEFKAATHAGVLYQMTTWSDTNRLNRALGSRPNDMPATLWEIVPYSFVVDWFVGVGSWLTAITPNPDVTVLGNWVTYTSETCDKFSGKIKYPAPSPLGTDSYSSFTATSRSGVFRRDCNQQLASFPVLKANVLPAINAIDGVALVLSKVLKGFRDFHR